MSLGALLKQKREKANLTQHKLASKLGWSSAQFVSNIERGVAHLPPAHVTKISAILGIPSEAIVASHLKEYKDRYTTEVYGKK